MSKKDIKVNSPILLIPIFQLIRKFVICILPTTHQKETQISLMYVKSDLVLYSLLL